MQGRLVDQLLDTMPVVRNGVVVVLSGGMDSAVTLRLAVSYFGTQRVAAIIFDYIQRQSIEVAYAERICKKIGVKYQTCGIAALGDIAKGFSANTDASMAMPGAAIKGVRATTYVPNRNMILMGFAAAYAEVLGYDVVFFGSQSLDTSHDNNYDFIQSINQVLAHNQKHSIRFYAPLYALNKTDEIRIIEELDGNIEFFRDTMTCYNPTGILSCGSCSACLSRLKAFEEARHLDPIPYITA